MTSRIDELDCSAAPAGEQRALSHPLADLLGRPEPLTWVFAGDSVTAGVRRTHGLRCYTEYFAERIRGELERWSDTLINSAVSGWRIEDLLRNLERSVTRHRPDILILGIGLNHCRDGSAGVERFEAGLRDFVAIVAGQGARIVLQTLNRWPASQESDGPGAHVHRYSEVISRVAEDSGLDLIDHLAEWQHAEPDLLDGWIDDGCHPNGLGHRKLAATAFRALGLWGEASETCRLAAAAESGQPCT